MTLQDDLAKFFNLQVHNPDSAFVRNELDYIWKAWQGPKKNQLAVPNWTAKWGHVSPTLGSSQLTLLSLLKYTARKHGLPSILSKSILTSLESPSISLATKYHLGLLLKYALIKDEEFVDLLQLIGVFKILLKNCHDNNDPTNSSQVLSQLVQSMAFKLTPDNATQSVMAQLEPMVRQVDSKTKSIVLMKLNKCGLKLTHQHEHQDQSTKLAEGQEQQQKHHHEEKFVRPKIDLDGEIRKKEGPLFKVGSSSTNDLGFVQKKASNSLKADAVKTQQAVVTVYKQNVSEKSEIEAINLTHALTTGRSASRGQQVASEINPALNNAGYSVRSYFRTTAMEVDFLLTRASQNLAICDDDLDYLRNKFVGFRFSLWDARDTTTTNIATIFSIVSQNQVLEPSILDSLAEHSFSTKLEPSLDNCRLKLLKTFELAGQRSQGRLPEKTEKVLTKFRKAGDCTQEMKKFIWRIFKRDDSNLYKNFQIAVEDLVNLRRPYDQSAYEDIVEYLQENVATEERACDLERASPFFEKLLTIIEDGKHFYTPPMRAEVAQLVDHILDHAMSPPLPNEWLQTLINCYDEAADWMEENSSPFQASLVRSILKTVNKINSDEEGRNCQVPVAILEFLVHVAIREEDRKLEALILICLGNSTIQNSDPNFVIPDAHRLAYKVTKLDAVDDEGLVFLHSDDDKEGKPKEVGHTGQPKLTYISAMAAQILLKSCKEFDTTTQNYLIEGLTSSPDKNTRIVSAECLFQASLAQELDELTLTSIQSFASDPVTDIRIYCSAAYCSAMAHIVTNNNDLNLTSHDLEELAKMYAVEPLTLGHQDFTFYVNGPILTIYKHRASSLPFTDLVFQLLTLILSGETHHQETEAKKVKQNKSQGQLALDILGDQIEAAPFGDVKTKIFPPYCLGAVQNIFLSNPILFGPSARILLKACGDLGQILGEPVLEEFYKNLEAEPWTEEHYLSFLGLFLAISVQDVPEHIFLGFDLEFVSARIIAEIGQESDEKQMKKFADQFSADGTKKNRWKSNLLETVQGYLAAGHKMSPLTVHVLEYCITTGSLKTNLALQCLTYASENGQSLSSKVIQTVFDLSSSCEPEILKILPRLALALVQNNQSLPPKFLDSICTEFCGHEFSKLFAPSGASPMILAILTKLVQNNQFFAHLPAVISKFCEGWNPSNGGSHRQRLELLSALSGVVDCGVNLVDLGLEKMVGDFKKVFLQALNDENGQILETGLQGFIAINTNGAKSLEFCDPPDFKLLVQIQRRSSSSQSIKNVITDFLSRHKNRMPKGLQVSINLSSLENKTDAEFLQDLPMLLKLQDYDFFQSPPCQKRLQVILETNQNSQILTKALQILAVYPNQSKLPISTYEAVAFGLINNPGLTQVRQSCQEILCQVIRKNLRVSRNLVRYLLADTQFNLELLLQISSGDSSSLISPELKAALQIQSQVRAKKLDEKSLKKFPPEVLNQVHLDDASFVQILQLNLNPSKLPLSLCNFVASNVLQINNFKIASSSLTREMERAGEILENCILNHGAKILPQVPEAVVKVLGLAYHPQQPKKLVKNLADLFKISGSSLELKCAILKCMAAIFKNVSSSIKSIKKPFIHHSTVQLLVDQVQGSTALIRKFSLQALHHLEDGMIKIDQKLEGKKIEEIKRNLIEHQQRIAFKIFEQIFQDYEDQVEEEMTRDEEFTTDLLSCLFSLTYWDIQSLQKVKHNRADWQRVLIISDFISAFTNSMDEQLTLYPGLDALYKKCEDSCLEFFHILSIKCGQLGSSKSVQKVISSMGQLEYATLLEILERPGPLESNRSWADLIEEHVVAQNLSTKFEFPVGLEIVQMLAHRFVTVVGTDLAQIVCSAISTIDSLTNFESFVHVFEGLKQAVTVKGSQKVKSIDLSQLKIDLTPSSHSIDELKIELECQILLILIPPGVPRRKRLERILKNLLTNGIPLEQLRQLVQMTLIKGQSKGRTELYTTFETITFQASQYQISPSLFATILNCLQKSKSKDYADISSKIISEGIFDGKHGVKDISEVIREFRVKNSRVSFKWNCIRERFVKAGYQWDILKLKMIQIQRGDKFSAILESAGPSLLSIIFGEKHRQICQWDASDIRKWAEVVKNREYDSVKIPPNEFYLEALMVAKVAIKLHRHFDLTRVQILSCLVALQKLDKDKAKGQLQQVATGSGKSAIIAVIAVIKALEGKSVDIYTSSPVLAERDAKEWSKFYDIFAAVTCDHNGDRGVNYISGSKTCYRKDIVYGDCSQFQFDYLRDNYSDLKTLAGRSCDFAIVDEVDSMFLDDSSKLARLSSTLPGMDSLQTLYHFIWDRLAYLRTHLFSIGQKYYFLEGQITMHPEGVVSYKYFDQDNKQYMAIPDLFMYILSGQDQAQAKIYLVEDIEPFVVEHLKTYTQNLISTSGPGQVKLPKHLKEFAIAQIPKWMDSALTALTFQENVHYIVDQDQIKPVDFQTTGVVQSSTNWNNGLHQFLGLKHSLRINSETVTTNFLSNMAMFSKYGSNVLGFTGTLGSPTGRSLLYNVYGVKMLTLPETHFKRYLQFPDIIASNEEDWLKEIVLSTLEETKKGRGVLVICETIKSANLVSATLASFKVKVKVYTKNEEEGGQEKSIERIHPGDVIVATNLAGRGTDIKTLDIEDFGGLHVCLTFLPQSQRIEEQAFGRTSRQGNQGTGQLIIVSNDPADLDHREKRDSGEKWILGTFKETDHQKILIKDKLFENFCAFFTSIRLFLKDQRTTISKVRTWVKDKVNAATGLLAEDKLSLYEALVLQSVEQRWAMFLRQIEDADGDIKGQPMSLKMALDLYTKFEESVRDQLTQGTDELLAGSLNVFYFIQLGNYEYYQGENEKAATYFDQAIEIDSDFSAGALVGAASVLLKESKGDNFKEEALKSLRQSLPLLHQEMARITVTQTLAQRQKKVDWDTPLSGQLNDKSCILGAFIKNVETNIEAIEKSLRRVYCTAIKIPKGEKNCSRSEVHCLPDGVIQGSREISWKDFDEYQLTFHDLSIQQDMMDQDQALKTLQLRESNSMLSRVPIGDVKKWWKSVKFQVTCSCDQADLKKLLDYTKLDILKEVPSIDLELRNLELDPTTKTIHIDLESIKAINVKSYSLEVAGDANFIKSLALHTNLCSESSFVQELKWTSEGKDGQPIKFTETLKPDKTQREDKIKGTGDHATSIKFLELKSPDQIHGITQIVQELVENESSKSPGGAQSPLSISLTFHSLDKEKKEALTQTWLKVLCHYGNNTIHLSEMPDGIARKVIPALRALQTPFEMRVTRLSFKSAQLLLQNASIDQELLEQTKVQELSKIFMQNRLPLMELQELSARGIAVLVSFSEKGFVPWINLITMCGVAALQIAAGGCLFATGFGMSVGMSLITEGFSDLMVAQRIYSTRKFSWTDYRNQKAVSLLISATTLGVGSWKAGVGFLAPFKDAAKGVGIIGKAAMGKAISQSTATAAASHLKTLAVKRIAAKGFETGARVGLKVLSDNVSSFCFEQVREQIEREVSARVETNFSNPKFLQLLGKKWALEIVMSPDGKSSASPQLKRKIEGIVQASMNPKASGSLWDTIGLPLSTGILSDPSFVGSKVSSAFRLWGIVKGVTEISDVIGRVCGDVQIKLSEESDNYHLLLQRKAGLSKDAAIKMVALLKFKPPNPSGTNGVTDFELEDLPPSQKSADWEKVKNLFKDLSKRQSSFGRKTTDLSLIERSVVDMATNHIIKVANSTLVSPQLSKLSGQIVGRLSAQFQAHVLVSEEDNSAEQNEIKDEVKQLKEKPENELTPEEKNYIRQNDRPITLMDQSNSNAKEFMIAYQRAELDEIMREDSEKSQNEGGDGEVKKLPNSVRKLVEEVATNAEATVCTLPEAAAAYGKKIKIVTDPNYQRTEEEKNAGVRIILREPPPPNSPPGTPGHFRLQSEDGQGFEEVPSSGGENNCGFDIIAKLSGQEGVTGDDVRMATANAILRNPEKYEKVIEITSWLENRFPLEVDKHLLAGGATEKDDKKKKRRKVSKATKDEKDDEKDAEEENVPPKTGKVKQNLIYDEERKDGTKKRKTEANIPLNVGPGQKTTSRTPELEKNRRLSRGESDRHYVETKFHRAHSVNRDLGGSADSLNITNQTVSANMTQKNVDNPIKELFKENSGMKGSIKQTTRSYFEELLVKAPDGTVTVEQVVIKTVHSFAVADPDRYPELVQKLHEKLGSNKNFKHTSTGYHAVITNETRAQLELYEPSSEAAEELTSETEGWTESEGGRETEGDFDAGTELESCTETEGTLEEFEFSSNQE